MRGDKRMGILRDSQRENLQVGLETGDITQSAVDNRKRRIRRRLKPPIHDMEILFNHLPQSVLENPEAFRGDAEMDEGPIAYRSHKNTGGFLINEFVDDDGNPRDPDPEINPEVKHATQKLAEELRGPKKANPETQEALIGAVGFLCRAAEAGELDPEDLIEQGMEAYYSEKAERDNRASERVVKVTSESPGVLRNRLRQKGDNDDLLPIESKFVMGRD